MKHELMEWHGLKDCVLVSCQENSSQMDPKEIEPKETRGARALSFFSRVPPSFQKGSTEPQSHVGRRSTMMMWSATILRRFPTNAAPNKLYFHTKRRILPHLHRTKCRPFFLTAGGPAKQLFSSGARSTSLRRQRRFANKQRKKTEPLSSPHALAQHQPPLGVRVALVSATTAVATPVFPAIGFVNLFLRVVLPDSRRLNILSASFGTVLSFSAWTLVPAFYSLAPVILPCAVGNGIVAGASFAALDALAVATNKTKWLYQNPLTGAAIGTATGFVAPYFAYGPLFQAMYGIDGVTESVRLLLAFPMATQVTMATGFAGGLAMYPVLYFPMNGISGLHWMNFSAPALLGVSLALMYVYTPAAALSVPEGTYVESSEVPLLDTVIRYNVETGSAQAYSLSARKWMGSVELVRQGRDLAQTMRSSPITFDDRLVAWMNSYAPFAFDGAANYPNHVVSAPNAKDLTNRQQLLLGTDSIVAFILQRNDSKRITETSTQTKLTRVIEKMDEINNRKLRSENRLQDQVQSMEALSVAVELLLLLKEQQRTNVGDPTVKSLIRDCEEFIQRHDTRILLYAKEDDPWRDESAQAQLEALEWNTNQEIGELLSKWQQVFHSDRQQRWRDLAIQGGGALLFSIVASMLLTRS